MNKKEPRLTKDQIENINGKLVRKGPISPVYRKPSLSKTMRHPNETDPRQPVSPLAARPLEHPAPRSRRSFHPWQDRLPDTSPYKPKPKK